jgi:colanic acid biosynthesis protein WcaH
MFIPEKEYQKILKSMPVFCIDYLIECSGKYLLIERNQEPLKGVHWVIGGRMQLNETLEDFAWRVQSREIGHFVGLGKLIGFSNYFFLDVENSRAIHTPTLLYHTEVPNQFDPVIDDTSCSFKWSQELPEELKKQTNFISNP